MRQPSKRGIVDPPGARLPPRPSDWSVSDWDQYQKALQNGFEGCMPRCCGRYMYCNSQPADLAYCQSHCLDMGKRRDCPHLWSYRLTVLSPPPVFFFFFLLIGHNNSFQKNPKTGKAAPYPTVCNRAIRRRESEYTEWLGVGALFAPSSSCPPLLVLPCLLTLNAD